MFKDRRDAGRQLGEALAGMPLERPVVLGVPRGGVIVGAEVARRLGAEFDVVLVRKLRHPLQPEFAIGAIGEDGAVALNPAAVRSLDDRTLETEKTVRMGEITRRRELYRGVRPPVDIRARDVVVVDDGVATGATMDAALRLLAARAPRRIIVALPVAPPSAIDLLSKQADEVVCLETPADFWAVGQHYENFDQTTDDEVVSEMASLAHTQ